MPKLTLPALADIHFATTIPVSVSHLNYGNHLGHDALVSILHEARVRFLTSLGYTELKVEDAGLILRDLAVQYKAEAFYGDPLRITLAVTDLSAHGFGLAYRVSDERDDKEVARAQTTMVCFDYASRRPMRLPESFRQRFGASDQ